MSPIARTGWLALDQLARPDSKLSEKTQERVLGELLKPTHIPFTPEISLVNADRLAELATKWGGMGLPLTEQGLKEFSEQRKLRVNREPEEVLVDVVKARAGHELIWDVSSKQSRARKTALAVLKALPEKEQRRLLKSLDVPAPAGVLAQQEKVLNNVVVSDATLQALAKRLVSRGIRLNERGIWEFRWIHGLGQSTKVDRATARAMVNGHAPKPKKTTGYQHGSPRKIKIIRVGTDPRGNPEYLDTRAAGPYLKLMWAAYRAGVRNLTIESGFRTNAQQKVLWHCWIHRVPGCNKAARPGYSNHQSAISADNGNLGSYSTKRFKIFRRLAEKAGFVFDVSGEYWHITYKKLKR